MLDPAEEEALQLLSAEEIEAYRVAAEADWLGAENADEVRIAGRERLGAARRELARRAA